MRVHNHFNLEPRYAIIRKWYINHQTYDRTSMLNCNNKKKKNVSATINFPRGVLNTYFSYTMLLSQRTLIYTISIKPNIMFTHTL